MTRSKLVKSEDIKLPAGVLRQTYGENIDDKSAEIESTASPSMVESWLDKPSTSSLGTDSDDFDLIHSVKEDLKQNIHKRRRQKGLGELERDSDLPRHYELTELEETKRRDRRERNRIAAAKCREKKRQLTDELVKDSEHTENRNRELKRQAEQLRIERDYLKHLLREHLVTCPKKGQGGCRR